MKKMLMATTAAALFATGAYAGSHSNEVKLGIVFGFTGPIESLTGPMASGAEMAMKEVTDSGKLMGGATVTPLRADSGCIDNALAVAGAERLIAEGINGLIGADCSGVTGYSKRHGNDLAFRHIARSVHNGRQRLVLPHLPIGCA